MTDLQELNYKSIALKQVIDALSTPELGHEADPELLLKKFLLLQKKLFELTKLTNAGKSPANLKTKLKVLKKWSEKYSDTTKYPSAAEIAIENLPKKYENRPIVLDKESLRKISYFRNYIDHIVNFMANLEPQYKTIKEFVSSILEKGQTLNQHGNKFLLTEDHIPSYDMLATDDKGRKKEIEEWPAYMHGGKVWEPEKETAVGPTKMITSMQAVLNQFHTYSVKVSEKYREVLNLAQELDNIDLGEFFTRTNQRNALIRRLLMNLSDLNKIIYQGDLPNKEYLRKQYYNIVDNCIPLLPAHIAARVKATIAPRRGKGQFQTAVDNAISSGYDPNKEQAQWLPTSPHLKQYKTPPETPVVPRKETLEDRVNRALRFQEIADIPKGKPLTPEEVAKYKKLWTEAQSYKQIMKLARYYKQKY